MTQLHLPTFKSMPKIQVDKLLSSSNATRAIAWVSMLLSVFIFSFAAYILITVR